MGRMTGFMLSGFLRKRARKKRTVSEELVLLRDKRESLLKVLKEMQRKGLPVEIPRLSRGGLTKGGRIANAREDVRKLEEAIKRASEQASSAQKSRRLEEQVEVARRLRESVKVVNTEEELMRLAEDLVHNKVSEKEVEQILRFSSREEKKLFRKFVNRAQVELFAKKVVYGQQLSAEEQKLLESMPKELKEHFDFARDFYTFVQNLVESGGLSNLSEEDKKFYEWIKNQPYWLKKLEKTLKERAE